MKDPDNNDARRANQEALVQALASAPLEQAQAAQGFLQSIAANMDTQRDRYDTGTRMAVSHALLACEERVSAIHLTAVRDAYTRHKPGD